jgi:hypothetical protein
MSAADAIKEPTCDNITTNDVLLAALEKRANEVVNTITDCIDAIRSVQEFHPPKDVKKILKSTRSGVDRMGVMSQVFLYQILKEKGLVKQVQNVCCSPLNDTEETMNHACIGNNDIGGFVEEGGAEDVEDYRHPLQRERERVVYEIFLPLLDRLVVVFHELDKVQGDPSTTHSPSTSRHDAKSQQLERQKTTSTQGTFIIVELYRYCLSFRADSLYIHFTTVGTKYSETSWRSCEIPSEDFGWSFASKEFAMGY